MNSIKTYGMSERADHPDFDIRSQLVRPALIRPHRHEYFQIQISLQGDTEQNVAGTLRPFRRGHLSFILPYRVHVIPHPEGSRYVIINMAQQFLRPGLDVDPLDLEDVPLTRAPELAPFLFQEYADYHFDDAEMVEVEQLLQKVAHENAQRRFGSIEIIRGLMLQLIGLTCRKFEGDLLRLAANRAQHASRRASLQRAVHYIREHLAGEITLPDVAAAAFLSPNYLAHLLKKETGKTFTDLVTERRLEFARDLLAHSSDQIACVAHASGFVDEAYFSRSTASVFDSRAGARHQQCIDSSGNCVVASARPGAWPRKLHASTTTQETAMTHPQDLTKRGLLQSGALMTAGAVIGCATPGIAANGPATPFNVPNTYVPIAGSSEVFPVRRIYCIGRNYAAHAIEMGSDPTREPPFFFQKPTDAIQVVPPGKVADHPYPTLTKNYHYEVELVAALSKGGRNIPQDKALDLVYGYALGLDMTRRDLQRGMGDQKKPWEIGKSFDLSAPIGPIHKVAQTGHYTKEAIWLKVNGQVKQKATLNHMIWSVAEQISKLSEAFELFPGDIIYSGTPENVGPVVKGDVIECHIDGLPELSIKIA